MDVNIDNVLNLLVVAKMKTLTYTNTPLMRLDQSPPVAPHYFTSSKYKNRFFMKSIKPHENLYPGGSMAEAFYVSHNFLALSSFKYARQCLL